MKKIVIGGSIIAVLVCVLGVMGLCTAWILGIGGSGPMPTSTSIDMEPSMTEPASSPTDEPEPIAALASLNIDSEKQADGSHKNTANLSLNSLGVGELSLTSPSEMDLNNTAIVRLSLLLDPEFAQLSSVAVPTQNSQLPDAFEYTDRISIYPIMQAELLGTGFEITSDGKPEKIVVSDTPVEWVWSIKPIHEGLHTITVVVSIPVTVDGETEILRTHTLKNIPVEIVVKKSLGTQLEETLPWLIPALLGFSGGLLGIFANSRFKQREMRIKELESQVAIGKTSNQNLIDEIQRLKDIPFWQFWRQ